MGKDDKEDTGFGFKDKQKALDTLRLLEQHDMNYRRLTVRGLLGRAKRVLSMTKAAEKKQNITEAMEVFENWLSELNEEKEKGKSESKKKEEKKDEKKDSKKTKEEEQNGDESVDSKDPPSDTVPGLGFKDQEAAEGTLKELAGRDPDYQRLAVKGLIGRAKRVLTCTKDTTKLSNIKSAISTFEKFLDDFETSHKSRDNSPYVSLGIVRSCVQICEEKGIQVGKQESSFISAYESVGGDYKKLRTVQEIGGGKTWDIVRNDALKGLKEKHEKAALFTDSKNPTPEHLELLLWAYSPDLHKTKQNIPESEPPREDRKRKSSGGEEGGKKRKE